MSADFSESSVRRDLPNKPEITALGLGMAMLFAGGCVTSPAAPPDSAADPAAIADLTQTRLVIELETESWADEVCYVALFQSRDGWLERDGWLVGRTVPVTPPLTVVVFDDVPAAPTAVSAFVDVARDESLTRNGLGIPVEPWGFSNDLSVLFGKPSFRSASVEVTPPETVIRFAIGTGLDRSAVRRARREAEGRESS